MRTRLLARPAPLVLVPLTLAPLLLALLLPAAPAVAAGPPAVVVAPAVTGPPTYGATLVASPGTWTPAPTSWAWQWLRDGAPVPGATASTYRPGLADLGRRLAVTVTAAGAEGSASATSAPTAPVTPAAFTVGRRPAVVGTARWTHTLTRTAGSWSPRPDRVSWQWLRDGRPIAGATGRRHRVRPADVGHRLRVRATLARAGHRTVAVESPARLVRHRVGVRRVVRYRVETRGRITTSVRDFARLAQETYDDARGWRSAGIDFRRVRRGAAFTLVLAEASWLPRFSSGCSREWSCRVGRFVVINQERWKHASRAWNAAGGPLRGYRHMVVNHETGHWLGLGHATCPGRGRPAPVMMQQSKGLHGCRFNAFPTRREVLSRTRSGRVAVPAPVDLE
ncbi:DUF3152 domain-containing protein [Nocardioides sp. SYSU D00038]|uniref:DUF3152 domain-containing protein n=1 Tax=Nocardioides sp. SYSU D00038 TaxID=2812554 RepID=UPI001967E527|nr:DUF3152 domain-containing protein [Nocardioides sp. SYSU D00038]